MDLEIKQLLISQLYNFKISSIYIHSLKKEDFVLNEVFLQNKVMFLMDNKPCKGDTGNALSKQGVALP
jgi:hypothetical protein